MPTGSTPEPPADDAGDDSPGTAGSPWWSAGDDSFAGATPLFDGQRRRHPDDPPLLPPPPHVGDVGSPIGEALKLAGAVLRWSQESGLGETLEQLAGEAAAVLADSLSADTTGDQADAGAPSDPPTNVTSIPLHRIGATEDGDEGTELVCDYCPLCRGMAMMRSVQPQMSQGVAEAMASMTAALNYAVEGFVRRYSGESSTGEKG